MSSNDIPMAFQDEFEIVDTMASRLVDGARMLHKALCRADLNTLRKLQLVSLIDLVSVYGEAAEERCDFTPTRDGRLITFRPPLVIDDDPLAMEGGF